jgi:hypothetical protein
MSADDDDKLELDDGDQKLIRTLRALPGEGSEPDWNALERSIREAVGPGVPRPWFKKWQWLVPIGALAVTAAAALLWLHRPEPEPTAPPQAALPAPSVTEPAATPEPAMAVWLDGKIIDLDEVDPSAILDDDDDRAAQHALATDDGSGLAGGILPAGDLGWIDGLDDKALDRAEQWLEKRKKS